ncbi:MAG: hypothetical protein ABSC18_17355, partial [Verrucomicrobiota bacterium]
MARRHKFSSIPLLAAQDKNLHLLGRAELPLTGVQLSGEEPRKNPCFSSILERRPCYRHELRCQQIVQKP